MLEIAGQQFDGPFMTTTQLKQQQGIYVVLGANPAGGFRVLDVGESSNIWERVTYHDRAPLWKQQGVPLSVAVLYTPGWPEFNRRGFEAFIRRTYNPPCGDQ